MTTLKETKNQKTTLNKEEKNMINLKAKEREAFRKIKIDIELSTKVN